MNINKIQAENIVRNLNDLIYDDIYVYHPSGELLASNTEIIEESILEYGKIVSEKKEVYVGNLQEYGRKALVLPVNIRNEMVAIIGLRGEYAAVTQYSDLVLKMAEILLSESRYYTTKIAKAERNRKFINELIQEKQDLEELNRIMDASDVKVSHVKFIAVLNPKSLMKEINLVIDSLEKVLHSEVLIGEFNGKIVILFWESIREVIHKRLEDANKYVYEKYGKKISIGVSNKMSSIQNAKEAYYQAYETLKLGETLEQEDSFWFEDYTLELLFENIDDALIESVIGDTFSKCHPSDIEKITELINVYIDNNTSLTKTSKVLFIHKNTLQYRLNWVEKMTGYNPRDTKQLFKLHMILRLLKNR